MPSLKTENLVGSVPYFWFNARVGHFLPSAGGLWSLEPALSPGDQSFPDSVGLPTRISGAKYVLLKTTFKWYYIICSTHRTKENVWVCWKERHSQWNSPTPWPQPKLATLHAWQAQRLEPCCPHISVYQLANHTRLWSWVSASGVRHPHDLCQGKKSCTI